MSFTFFEEVTKKVRDDMVNSIVNYRSLDWVTEAWDNTHKYVNKRINRATYLSYEKSRKNVIDLFVMGFLAEVLRHQIDQGLARVSYSDSSELLFSLDR